MKKIIVYDFDGTLTPFSLPKFEILEKCGMKDGAYNPLFLELSQKRSKEKSIDLYQAMYDTYFQIIKEAGFELTDKNFCLGSDDVIYNNDVMFFLDSLCKNGISNYLLSSGIKVFLEKISIAPYFKDIYATTFKYDHNNEVIGIDFLMSDKNKVTAIKEILQKNGNGIDDCSDLIYIGDGFTDYYAMKYVKEHGGTSIFVYTNPNNKDIAKIKEKNVVDFYAKADYSQKGELNSYVKKICKIK